MTTNDGCICRGNWRLIVEEYRHLFDKKYRDERTGFEYVFFGIVHSSDDYYYGMWSKDHGMILLTCVGSIDGQGFELIE